MRLFRVNSNRGIYAEQGVTMVEFALVLPLLMIFTIGLIDLSRVYALKAILNKGAEEGLNIALKIPNLDEDIQNLDPGSVEYQRYLQARNVVIARATSLPLGTLFTDSNTPSMAQLTDFVYRDPNPTGPDIIRSSRAAIIRPGERIEIGVFNSGKWSYHKTLPGTGTPPPQSPDLLLKSHPMIVELRATIRPMTPFIGELNVRSRAMGYREEIPKGPLNVEFGLLDPTTTTSSTSSTTSTTTTTLPAPAGNITCDPNWSGCAALTGNFECPDLNAPPPPPPGFCPCRRCQNAVGPTNPESHLVLF